MLTAKGLQQLAQQSSPGLRIQTDSLGVEIELADPPLRFHHSFISGPIARRAGQTGQLLLKACNNRQRNIHSVLDLTAGWGVDSYLLARQGQDVTMVEKNRLVQGIVAYSLEQLAGNADGAEIAHRIKIINAESLVYLEELDSSYDCIYLDPMFPAHKSGAKPAKEMQVLQALTDNTTIESCFELALQHAAKRVVVKRAAKAPTLTTHKPDMVLRAKTIRFDIYQTT